jgi:hypothetical protein
MRLQPAPGWALNNSFHFFVTFGRRFARVPFEAMIVFEQHQFVHNRPAFHQARAAGRPFAAQISPLTRRFDPRGGDSIVLTPTY